MSAGLLSPEQAREILRCEGFEKIHEAKAEFRHFELWGHKEDLKIPNRILSINIALPDFPTARLYTEITSQYFGEDGECNHGKA